MGRKIPQPLPSSAESPLSPAPLDVVLVGPGRLGRSAAVLLERGGHRVRLVSRGAAVPRAPVTWLTVPDRAIAEAAAAVPAGGVLLHASGATDVAPLRPHRPAGSLHPLMTFPGPEVGMPPADPPPPAAVAGDADAVAVALRLAEALGWEPFEVPGDRRLYHAAAVVAGNQATALLGMAAELLVAAGVAPDAAPRLLAPLALSSVRNAAASSPAQALTGPVARGDEAVLAAHRAAIAAHDPALAAHYDALTTLTRRLLRPSPLDDAGPGEQES